MTKETVLKIAKLGYCIKGERSSRWHHIRFVNLVKDLSPSGNLLGLKRYGFDNYREFLDGLDRGEENARIAVTKFLKILQACIAWVIIMLQLYVVIKLSKRQNGDILKLKDQKS